MIDAKKTMAGYLGKTDWRVNENSNVNYSIGGLILHNSGAVTANYWLEEVYPREIAEAHRTCAFHIHDLSMLSGYCAGWSLRQLIAEGLGGVPDKITSRPARHFSTLIQQMVNFLGIMQNEWAGAQAFSSFDTYLAPFVKADNLSEKEAKQCLQSFVFGVNTPSRWGSQAPFTNITLDWTCPDDLRDMPAIVGGEEQSFTYGDCQREMDLINRLFIELMMEGDAAGRGFQYPIPTYSITRSFDWDSENAKRLFEMTARYGTPYFQNFVNSDLNPSDVRSMCPLAGDTEVLVKSAKGVCVRKIQELYCSDKRGCAYSVWDGFEWRTARLNEQEPQDVVKVSLSNNASVKMGIFHRQPVLRNGKFDIIPAGELKTGDKIPYNKNCIETERGGTYDLGFVAGAYAGDGSHCGDSITFSLDTLGRKDDAKEKIIRVLHDEMGFNYSIGALKKKACNIRFSVGSYSVVSRFVEGNSSVSKALSKQAFNMSAEWRQGFIDGLCATDGSRKKRRIYTSSEKMASQLIQLFNTLGKKAYLHSVDKREGRLGHNPVYCIACPDREKYGSLFSTDGKFAYWSVESVEPAKRERLYCMEVDNETHTFMLADGMITGNCRLQLDKRELRKRGGGLFGSDEFTGSIGVVTINLPQIGYLSKTEGEFFARLGKLMELARQSLEIKRETIARLLDAGLFPYTRRYLAHFNNHFATIGVCGMNEACLNLLGCTIASEEGRGFAERVLDYMRERLADFQEDTGNLYNLEATPAEGASYRLAKHDKERFPDIITAGNEEPYYTNSSQLPVDLTDDVFDALDLQDTLQTKYTGGTVFHVFLGDNAAMNVEACGRLVKTIAFNYRLPYFSISPTFSVCTEHGYFAGEHFECPKCGRECEVYARIVGYYRSVRNWNKGKREEYRERVMFRQGAAQKGKKEATR